MRPLFNSNYFNNQILNDKRTVCVLHRDGHVTEHKNITDPWRYITKVKKEMNVKNAWVKES